MPSGTKAPVGIPVVPDSVKNANFELKGLKHAFDAFKAATGEFTQQRRMKQLEAALRAMIASKKALQNAREVYLSYGSRDAARKKHKSTNKCG